MVSLGNEIFLYFYHWLIKNQGKNYVSTPYSAIPNFLRDVGKFQLIWFEESSFYLWSLGDGSPTCVSHRSSPLARVFPFLSWWLPEQTSVPLHRSTQTAQVIFKGLWRTRDLELEGILPTLSPLLLCYFIKLPLFRTSNHNQTWVFLHASSVHSPSADIVHVYVPSLPRDVPQAQEYVFVFVLLKIFFSFDVAIISRTVDYRLNEWIFSPI